MKTTFVLIILTVMSVLLLSSCCDNQVQPDPCAGVAKNTANFTMSEVVTDSLRYETDTIYTGNTVEFKALNSTDSCVWTLSGDNRKWTTRSFQLNFKEFVGELYVSLVTTRVTPKLSCFPDDKTSDTVIKKLVVVNYSLVFGNYRGVSTINPLDTYVVSIKKYPDSRWITINNLVNGCADTSDKVAFMYVIRSVGFREFYFKGDHASEQTCLFPDGLARLVPNDNSLLVNYSLRDTTVPRNGPLKLLPYTFKGVRL